MKQVAVGRPVAITMGDAAGIGPEIIAKAYLQQPALMRGSFVIGDVACMRIAAAALTAAGVPSLPVLRLASVPMSDELAPRCIPVLQEGDALGPVLPGQLSATAGRFAGCCVMRAAELALHGVVAAVVTAPLHKEALHAGGAPFDAYPGHTELLQDAAAQYLQQPALPVRMMLANDELRTVLVSIHVSLRQAIEAVHFENVLQTLCITHESLSRILGRAPRIAVAGLNPHAGEGGLFGVEERDIIVPAMQAARARGCDVSGPWPPDTVFMRARRRAGQPAEFDVVVAMYHDQGLIPVKYLGVESGVNVTLGLPFVRTSPDHGTAFDIAGSGRADPASFLAAMVMARQLIST
jgi:4-hydroxythreonine-4-phosphate dehydrogenase